MGDVGSVTTYANSATPRTGSGQAARLTAELVTPRNRITPDPGSPQARAASQEELRRPKTRIPPADRQHRGPCPSRPPGRCIRWILPPPRDRTETLSENRTALWRWSVSTGPWVVAAPEIAGMVSPLLLR